MKKEILKINTAPAVVYGEPSDKVFLFVHGQFGRKEEAEPFAEVAELFGYQVLAVDLPEHNGREDSVKLLPWKVVPELSGVLQYMKTRWKNINLRATSIGVWFSLLAFANEQFDKTLLISPLLNMERMILSMMDTGNVSEERLQKEKNIVTPLGAKLSWRYLCYARENCVHSVGRDTHILYGENDAVIPRSEVAAFAENENCRLTVADGCEHWFHTEEQLRVLKRWEEKVLTEAGENI